MLVQELCNSERDLNHNSQYTLDETARRYPQAKRYLEINRGRDIPPKFDNPLSPKLSVQTRTFLGK